MSTRYQLALVAMAAVALGACAPESSELREPAGEFAPPAINKAGCYVYPVYSVASCDALVKRASLTGADKTAYTYKSSSDSRYRAPVYLLDLAKISLSQQITKNFRLSEYMSTSKGRYGYIAEHVFTYMQKIRDSVGTSIRITSGFRSPGYNKKIGGASLSRHMYGDGIDFASGVSLAKLQAACRAQGATYIQLYTDGHIHCDWRGHKLDATFFSGPGTADLTPAQIVTLSEHEFARLQESIGGRPEISLAGEPRLGSEVKFTADLAESEDGGELYTEWLVTLPDGRSFATEGRVLSLRLEQEGRYHVQTRVGGYAENYYLMDVTR